MKLDPIVLEALRWPCDYSRGYIRGALSAEMNVRDRRMWENYVKSSRAALGYGFLHACQDIDPWWRMGAIEPTCVNFRILVKMCGGKKETGDILRVSERSLRRWTISVPPHLDTIMRLQVEVFGEPILAGIEGTGRDVIC